MALALFLPAPFAWSQSTAPPANDLFANRIVLTGLDVTTTGTNTYATSEVGEPDHAGPAARSSLWWSWQAPYSGVLQVSLTNISFPTPRLAVYVGDALNNLSVVASNAATSEALLNVPVQAGTTYQFAVDQRGPLALINGFRLNLSLRTLLLTQPAPERRFRADLPVTIVATNTETDRDLIRVDLLANNNVLRTFSSPPFALNWTSGSPGRALLEAVATNSLGERRVAPAVWITLAPTNDNFADAAIISPESLDVNLIGENNTASAEPGEPAHATVPAARSIWWRWTPSHSGHVALRTPSPGTSPLLAVYTGNALDNLVGVAVSANGTETAQANFDVSAGTTYSIAADGTFSGTNSQVILQLSLATLRFSTPTSAVQIIAGDPLSLEFTNYNSGPPLSAVMLVNDHVIANGLTVPGSMVWSTNAPGDYTLVLHGTNNLGEICWSDPLTVHVAPVPPPKIAVNDNFENRIALSAISNWVVVDISMASLEAGEPRPITCNPSGQTVWWTYTAPTDGLLCLQPGSGAVCSIFQGDTLSSLQLLDSSCSQSLYRPLHSGQTVQIALDGASGNSGIISLTMFLYTAANDNFTASLRLEGTNCVVSTDNFAASLEAGENGPMTNGAGRTLWYSWEAPASGMVKITSWAPMFDQALAVYTGPDLSHLSRIVAGRDSLRFLAEAGTIYRIQLDGADQAYGAFTLNLQFTPFTSAGNDDFANAIAFKGTYGSSEACINYATLELGEPAHRGGAPCKSLWWRWEVPLNSSVYLSTYGSLATNISLHVYTGSSVDTLTMVARGTNSMNLNPAQGGTVLWIAAVTDGPTQGDVVLNVQSSIPFAGIPSIPVPGNLLCEPSFEGTGLQLTCWTLSPPSYGGYVGANGGADGATWITLASGVTLSQEFATTPGMNYEIRFAYALDFGAQSGKIRARWNGQELGIADLPQSEGGYWHWTNFTGTATGATTRVSFEVLEGVLSMDAFSVVPLSAAPVIITQPASASTFVGAAASFLVGASGSPPLGYQWYFNTNALTGENNKTLTLNPVSSTQAGAYRVIVTNAYGAITSAPATLVVESPNSPTIVLQPYSDAVAVGGFFAFSVAAVGAPPLHYQWFLNSNEILDATNRQYVIVSAQSTNAGTYSAKVWNASESVWSLPAVLTIQTNATGGGALLLGNEMPDGGLKRRVWIFDTDETTRLSGSNYLAQLYAGRSVALIRPVGPPQPFQIDAGSNSYAGLIVSRGLILPTVGPGASGFAQVRVWEASRGASYEEARALGGKFGRSEVFGIVAGVMPDPPPLWGLQSFSLHAGLSEFVAGRINLAESKLDGTVTWALVGQAGYRYVIEKRTDSAVWQPLMVLTNQTGTVLFSDPDPSEHGMLLFRARILE